MAEIRTPYGTAETLPVTDIGDREILGEAGDTVDGRGGTCGGRPLKGMKARIVEIRDGPIPDWKGIRELPVGTVGEITVKGPVVSRGYFKMREATAYSKIRVGSYGGILEQDGGCLQDGCYPPFDPDENLYITAL